MCPYTEVHFRTSVLSCLKAVPDGESGFRWTSRYKVDLPVCRPWAMDELLTGFKSSGPPGMPTRVESSNNRKIFADLPVCFCGPPGRKGWTSPSPTVDLPYKMVDLPVSLIRKQEMHES